LSAGRAVDWQYYLRGARGLFGDSGLSIYALDPNVQLGPLSLLLAAAADLLPGGDQPPTAIALTSALLVPTLHVVRRLAEALGKGPLHPAAMGFIAVGWFSLAMIGQPADALALLGALAAIGLVAHRPALAGTALAVGALFKPWTLALAPVLLAAPSTSGRIRAIGMCGLVGVTGIAPFLIADPGTLGAGRVAFYVSDTTWLRFVGMGDVGPDGWRGVQLAACLAVGIVLAWLARGSGALRTAVVIATGCALMRLMTDLGTWPYYVSVVLPLAALVDATRLVPWPSRTTEPQAPTTGAKAPWPWVTTLTFVSLINPSPPLSPSAAAVVRLIAELLALWLTLCAATAAGRGERSRTA
jgi:hypothetical protein